MRKITNIVDRFTQVHGNRYDYSRVIYMGNKKKVEIGCATHGWFWQTPMDHLQRKGCRECGKINSVRARTSNAEIFIKKAKALYGDKYDYSLVEYVNATTRVKIKNKQTGQVFEQQPNNHLSGHGSVVERDETFRERYKKDTAWFLTRANHVHGNTYSYRGEYEGSHTYVDVFCEQHGWFSQLAYCHLAGQGCPSCPTMVSSGEIELLDYIRNLGFDPKGSDRSLIYPYELDIIVPEKRIALEYCGIYWHSELSGGKDRNYHLNKLNLCANHGYDLITIFETEWLNSKSIVESRLRHIFGVQDKSIGARHVQVKQIEYGLANRFYDQYHLQGRVPQIEVSYGGFYEDRLVGVMSFCKPRAALGRKNGPMELVRFATDGKSYPGLGSKLLNRFIDEFEPSSILSYSDRRWSTGNFYRKLGFTHDGSSKPNYSYTKNYKELEHRFKYRKSKLVEQFGESGRSEWEIMQENGYDRIWDCGTDRWVWNILGYS